MPNHVRLLFTPGEAWTLAKLVQAWKSWTGRRANALRNKGGAFWQREYFDRYMAFGRGTVVIRLCRSGSGTILVLIPGASGRSSVACP